MKPQSCKAKGRKAQQKVVSDLLELGAPYGLEPDDILSRGMGQNGVDVMLSPAAKKVLFDLLIEVKCVEALNVVTTFLEHHTKYQSKDGLKLLVHSKNRTPQMVTLMWEDFLTLFAEVVKQQNTRRVGFMEKAKKK